MTFTVERLSRLPDDEFKDLVDQEIRISSSRDDRDPVEAQRAAELSAALRDPKLASRWYLALIQMKKSVESQLGAKRSDLLKQRPSVSSAEFELMFADFHRWRAGALRFKSGVEDRLLQIRSQRPDPSLTDLLVKAITQHKHTMSSEFADEVSDADLLLWSSVDKFVGVG